VEVVAMTMWLFVLLILLIVGALVWRSERRSRSIHPGSGPSESAAARESGRGDLFSGGTGGGAPD
jgi:hypothetical protein